MPLIILYQSTRELCLEKLSVSDFFISTSIGNNCTSLYRMLFVETGSLNSDPLGFKVTRPTTPPEVKSIEQSYEIKENGFFKLLIFVCERK